MAAQPTVGRPRSFDEDEALDRALEVFWRLGAVNTTTRILETELGMTQSSIYNAFGSKNALLDRALDRYLTRIDAEIVSILDGPESGKEEILTFLDQLLEWVSVEDRPGCLMLNLLAEQSVHDPSLVDKARAYRDRLREALSRSLMGAGVDEAPVRAELLVAGVMGLNIAARGGASRQEINGIAEALRTQILAWYL